ncbi:AAA family ATPase [Halomonas vilamensis]|uniref:AAA family ATPase n=1 Tax=Vreelandella vilamensis TaxID=531309 RepID=A0ABU1H5B7_9GAMM|nr:AAA family ATPase [Halomonas vilamensis]MDR5899046.1 AAA family ATPase [Halomonas vilamensis]
MKILALRLENLASLPGPLELDFTAAPLAEAGLFAITGPTGAGKSTLLDALCLALYGNTPRLRQAPGQNAPLPDIGEDTIGTSDPRTLLRRGTASGYAEVDFLGRDGRRYRARWFVRRARKRADGKLQSVEQSLRDLETDQLLTTQKREFDRLLVERLGLNFDQFTRAVLLAQSEFAAFLTADDNTRSDLLERLTGTAEYSEISKAAYRRASTAKRAVEALQTRLADDVPANADARAELERTTRESQQALNALADKRQALTRQVEIATEAARLTATLEETRRAQARARTEHAEAITALEHADAALARAHTNRETATPALNQARKQALTLARVDEQLREQQDAQRKQQRLVATLTDDFHKAQRTQHAHQRELEAWRATLKTLLGEAPHLDHARRATREALDHAANRQLALETLAHRWQTLTQAERAHQRLSAQSKQAQTQREQLLNAGKTARQQLDVRQRHFDSVSAFVERARAVRSDSVITLRAALQEGEPCPVCGGLEHPFRHHPPATPEAAQLAAQEADEAQQLQEAQQALDTAREHRDRLYSQYSAVDAALKQHTLELEHTRQQRDAADQALTAHSLYDELANVEIDKRDTWLQTQHQASDTTRKRHEQTLTQLAEAEDALAPLEKALHDDALALARLETEKNSAEQQLTTFDAQLPPLHAQRDACQQQLASLLGDHASPDAWQQALDTQVTKAQRARDTASDQQHAAAQTALQLDERANTAAERLTQLQNDQAQLEREKGPPASGAAAELPPRLEALEAEQRALTPRLAEAQQARDEAAHALRDDERKRERQQAGQAELDAARAEYRRWGQISELIGSADGKAFRRIAQAYNLEQLLEHANAHLAGLSRRYRLVRGGSELGLLVEDLDMADERRSVHSLSGGETFLVSLALALGLASMASGELVIESLFIDEGFGSLDPQSLALAMDALDGLQALGRRVGVISHVQEMHERIPVQIQIEPLGNGTSQARLVSV